MNSLLSRCEVEYIKNNTNHRKIIPLKDGNVLTEVPNKYIQFSTLLEPLQVMVVDYDSPYEAVDCVLPPDEVQEPNPTTRNPVRTLTWLHKA